MGTKAWVGLALFMGLWATNLAVAADWSIVPSVTQRSEFNSNLNLDYTNPISDFILSLTTATDYNYTTEISQLQGHLGLTAQHYITNSNIDHIDQNFQINGRYQAAPRINLTLNTAYISDSSLAEEIQASGLVMSRSPRNSIFASPGLTYNITERLLGTINYNFNRVMYQEPQYINYTNHQAGLNFTYLMKNEKTSLISNNIVRESLYADGNNFKSIGIYVGANHNFSERWDVNFMVGTNISFFSYNNQVMDSTQFPYFVTFKTKRVDSSSVSLAFNGATTYRWTNLSVSAGVRRDQNPSAYGAVYEVNQLNLSANYQFTERLSGGLSGSYSLSSQSGQNSDSQYNYYNFGANLSYQITEKLSVSPGYSYSSRSNLTGEKESAYNHIAWIQLTYTYPIHYQK